MKATFPRMLMLMFFTLIFVVEAQAAPKGLTGEPFKMMDLNRDNKISEKEFIGNKTGDAKARTWKLFRSLDRDHDNSLRYTEFKKQGDQMESRGVRLSTSWQVTVHNEMLAPAVADW